MDIETNPRPAAQDATMPVAATREGEVVSPVDRELRAFDPAVAPEIEAPQPAPDRSALWRRALAGAFGARGSFVLFALVPILVCSVYLAFVASDQYMAEAQFAVRTAGALGGVPDGRPNAASPLSLPNLADQDAYVIADYVRSQAIFADLPKSIDVRAIFSRPGVDFWSRLPADAGIERLSEYWRSMVLVYVDGPSGVVTVRVRAFRPDDAQKLAQAVVDAAERLANRMSARELRDVVAQAEGEVRRAQGLVADALSAERAYRDKIGFVDPVKQADDTSKLLLATLAQKIQLQARLYAASRALAANSPTVTELKTQVAALDDQIAGLRAKLTGAGDGAVTVAAALAQFDKLEIQRQFAEKLYSLAQDSLERARLTAERQNVYLAVFDPPSAPQSSQYPQRWGLIAVIAAAILSIWGIAALTVATVLDHTY